MDEGQSGDDLVAQFARWAAAERASGAAGARARERSLRDQAVASATWTGVVVDLAERGVTVSLTVGAERRRGVLVAVGRDFCVLEQRGRRPALIALAAVSALSLEQPEQPDRAVRVAPPTGDRQPSLQLSLAAALSALAEERAPVRVVVNGGHQVDGDLVGAGEDVLTLRTEAPARRLVHVPNAAVAVCELR